MALNSDELIVMGLFTTLNVVMFLVIGWGQVRVPLACALIGSAVSWAAWYALGKQNWIVPAGFFVSLGVLGVFQFRRHQTTMRKFDGDWRK